MIYMYLNSQNYKKIYLIEIILKESKNWKKLEKKLDILQKRYICITNINKLVKIYIILLLTSIVSVMTMIIELIYNQEL